MSSSRLPICMTCSSWLLLCLAQFPAPGRCWIGHNFKDKGVWWYLIGPEIWFLLTSILHEYYMWFSFRHVKYELVLWVRVRTGSEGSLSHIVLFSFFSCYCDKNALAKATWKRKGLFGSQFPVTVYHYGEAKVAGTWSSYWHYTQSMTEQWMCACVLVISLLSPSLYSSVSWSGNDPHPQWLSLSTSAQVCPEPHLLGNSRLASWLVTLSITFIQLVPESACSVPGTALCVQVKQVHMSRHCPHSQDTSIWVRTTWESSGLRNKEIPQSTVSAL